MSAKTIVNIFLYTNLHKNYDNSASNTRTSYVQSPCQANNFSKKNDKVLELPAVRQKPLLSTPCDTDQNNSCLKYAETTENRNITTKEASRIHGVQLPGSHYVSLSDEDKRVFFYCCNTNTGFRLNFLPVLRVFKPFKRSSNRHASVPISKVG